MSKYAVAISLDNVKFNDVKYYRLQRNAKKELERVQKVFPFAFFIVRKINDRY